MAATRDIYCAHFGLSDRPFMLLPDPQFIFWSPAHRRAAAVLDYGIMAGAPITLITGEVGSGKTTLLRHLLSQMDDEVEIALISNAFGDRSDLLHWVLTALDQEVPEGASYVRLFTQFQDHLVEQYARGRRVVLIFDEAQNLTRDALEEIRMYTNINFDDHEILQLILVGQPELRDMVMRPDMTQFAQRVAASFFLPALSADMVGPYIGHRLKVVGGREDIFDADAVALIAEVTGGVPRLVNQICEFAMLYAFDEGGQTVSRATVQQVLDDGIFFGEGAARPLRLVHRVDTPPRGRSETS